MNLSIGTAVRGRANPPVPGSRADKGCSPAAASRTMPTMGRTLRIPSLAVLVLGCCIAASVCGQTDGDFLAARAAFDRGDRNRLDALAPKLAEHVLAPYVEFWQRELRLDTPKEADVAAYLARWPNTPLADRLRLDWLKALGKRGEWSAFGAAYLPSTGEDTELACYGLQYRRQRDGDAVLADAKPIWFTGQKTPEACDPLFEALIAKEELTIEDRRARFRLASEAGNVRLAQSIAKDMPPGDRISAAEFARVDRNPGAALARGDFRWKQQGGRDLALYALERAARSDAAGVRAAWEKQRGRLDEAERLYGNARIAFHAARQLNPLAAEWFREAGDAALSEGARAWRVRAALRARAWPDVLTAIEAMPPAEAQDSAWRYWKARALAAAGRVADAMAIHAGLADEASFYGMLSAEAIGRRQEIASRPLDPDAEALAAFGARADVRRAVKLAQLDMRPESQREWYYVVRGLADDALLLAAEYARRQGLYDRAINTAERTSARHDFGLRYLMPFRAQFTAAAQENEVEAALLFGIARQESRFAADIVSSAGAVGLMQLMPPTARWVAKQLRRADYRPSQISDVETNTRFGAYYFKYWLDRLDSMPALAAAAYNAGPGRAQAWRAGAPVEGAVWVETIPFTETRDYVKKVLANAMVYARSLDQSYVPLTARLGTVQPRDNGAATARAGSGD
jgi:soluble lytic murein transglycosylase